ncbi:hypothetical protein, partial [Methylobacterium sp. WL120]|uniref:hypothetical protein n=1 Tax=Methylobacterium sp. WL120 TaxID=2603887 RepID=UPI0011CCB0D2
MQDAAALAGGLGGVERLVGAQHHLREPHLGVGVLVPHHADADLRQNALADAVGLGDRRDDSGAEPVRFPLVQRSGEQPDRALLVEVGMVDAVVLGEAPEARV